MIDKTNAAPAGDDRHNNAVVIGALPDLLDLVARSYRALHRGEWEEGETESELSDRINDVMCYYFGNDWLDNNRNIPTK